MSIDDKYLTSRKYPMNDLGSVYSTYNPKTGRNEPPKTINTKNGGEDNGEGSK